MGADTFFSVEVTLAETCGPMFRAGHALLFLRFMALEGIGPARGEARVELLVRRHPQAAWQGYAREVPLEEARAFARSLRALGIPGRCLDVESISDTSDSWSDIDFRVRTDEGRFELRLDMRCSGYRGADAEGLRGLFAQLFALTGQVVQSAAL
jgi:hypothetical protein